jgi:hypothetical protein
MGQKKNIDLKKSYIKNVLALQTRKMLKTLSPSPSPEKNLKPKAKGDIFINNLKSLFFVSKAFSPLGTCEKVAN